MKLLYVKDKTNKKNNDEVNNFKIIEFNPSILKTYLKGEKKHFKITLVRLWFQLISLGKGTLFCAIDNSGVVMHTSYLMPKCFKFPFLNKNEYEIGPCNTLPEFRGQGIYPKVLEHIVNTVGTESARFYMVVDSGNLPSVRGIEKAGFAKCGVAEVTGFFKRYKIKELF